jgi:transcription initiation factor TFIIIB Brf1 subunit/transcription initiation factor TFIIB
MCDCSPEAPDPVLDCGSEICRGCGVVLQTCMMEDGPEWHGTRDGDGNERSRVGMPSDPFGHLDARPTFLSAAPGRALGVSKRVLGSANEDGSRLLREGLAVLEQLAIGLSFQRDAVAVLRARELFGDYHARKTVRSDMRTACAAAAMYYGAKIEHAARELKMVAGVCGVHPKALSKAVESYKDVLAGRPYYADLFTTLSPQNLVNMYADRLTVSDAQRKAVKRTSHRLSDSLAGKLDTGRKPATICSGLLYISLQKENICLPKKAVLDACGICQQTLDRVVAEITEVLLK